MRNIKLTLQYDGTCYCGWQRQKNTRRTIQEVLERSLRRILGERVELTAASRTDAGVHAKEQTANFLTSSALPAERLMAGANAVLPADIRVSMAQDVSSGFHSRFGVKLKTYRYSILNRRYHDVFRPFHLYLYPHPLDAGAMGDAARFLVGYHDFSSFRKSGSAERDPNIRVERLTVNRKGDEITIDVTARNFLYGMVRAIAGTLIEVGSGSVRPGDVKKILAAQDRTMAGPAAPACGLCLMRVKY